MAWLDDSARESPSLLAYDTSIEILYATIVLLNAMRGKPRGWFHRAEVNGREAAQRGNEHTLLL